MEITQVKIFPVQEDKLKAFVSVVFDHCFMVNDIKVIQGKDGLFLSMPSRRKKTGEFKDVAHPLNNETRRMLEESVLREYRREVDDRTPRRPDRPMDMMNPASPPENPRSQRHHGESPVEAVRSADVGTSDMAGSGMTGPGMTGPARAGSSMAGSANAASTNAASTNAASTNAASTNVQVAAAAPHEKTLEEVQEIHLSDSFWSVS